MELLKEVFRHDVQPARGCTEPAAIALACSKALAAANNNQTDSNTVINEVHVTINPGILKNAMGVIIPNSQGEKGCAMAAALGVLGGDSNAGLEVLHNIKPEHLTTAQYMIKNEIVKVVVDTSLDDFYISAIVKTSNGLGHVIVKGGHTNITLIECDRRIIYEADVSASVDNSSHTKMKDALFEMTIDNLVELAKNMDESDREHVRSGIAMNLAAAAAGRELGKYGSVLAEKINGSHNLIETSSVLTACATDARMSGANLSVMSSGGSGNQGVITILVPYNVGKSNNVAEKIIEESIALAHLVNSYIKVFTGDLSPICGCAISAGVGAAAAIVYQSGKLDKIGMAINTTISGIAGILCDGAKCGCTLKVLPSVASCIHAANFAINGLGASENDGIIGCTPEITIHNLGKICKSILSVDNVLIKIMTDKI